MCILVLKKCKKYDDVLFINASEHFENGKRQNVLLPEHIEKIIETYQYRKEEERYSRRVSMEEIEKNDFNLNISRYIRPKPSRNSISGWCIASLPTCRSGLSLRRKGTTASLMSLACRPCLSG